MQNITPAQLAPWASAQAQRPVLLGVREGWELQTASATAPELDLVHMPMQTIPARMDELDRARPIACLCHHGVRSHRVAMWLRAQGYETYNIEGGIDAWAHEVDQQMPRY